MRRWISIAKRDDLQDGEVIEVVIGAEVLAVYGLRDNYFVTDGICTHERAHLADGCVIGGIIECPKHQGRFDIVRGMPKGAPASRPLRTYLVRLDGADVCVELEEASPSAE